jgi:hypothetical protein
MPGGRAVTANDRRLQIGCALMAIGLNLLVLILIGFVNSLML